MEKKAIITGHTSGLGAAISSQLQSAGYATTGLSRKTGHDLLKGTGPFIDAARDADVFINNAYCGFINVQLLYQLFEIWRNQDKIIVNISSDSADGIKDFPHPYAIAKGALDKAAEELQHCPESRCRIIQIRCGYIDTPRVDEVSAAKMKPEIVAGAVLWCLQQPPDVYVRSLTLRAREGVNS